MMDGNRSPFYQGELDVFCAAYAVCNALRLLHGMHALEGRSILHRAIMEAASDPQYFQLLLEQQIDYTDWVDEMLNWHILRGDVRVEQPFAFAPQSQLCTGALRVPDSFFPMAEPEDEGTPEPDEVWQVLESWVSMRQKRCALFQFIRFLPLGNGIIRHWTCCRAVQKDAIVFYDCSREEGSLQSIARANLITRDSAGVPNKVLIPPHTIRLLASLHVQEIFRRIA